MLPGSRSGGKESHGGAAAGIPGVFVGVLRVLDEILVLAGHGEFQQAGDGAGVQVGVGDAPETSFRVVAAGMPGHVDGQLAGQVQSRLVSGGQVGLAEALDDPTRGGPAGLPGAVRVDDVPITGNLGFRVDCHQREVAVVVLVDHQAGHAVDQFLQPFLPELVAAQQVVEGEVAQPTPLRDGAGELGLLESLLLQPVGVEPGPGAALERHVDQAVLPLHAKQVLRPGLIHLQVLVAAADVSEQGERLLELVLDVQVMEVVHQNGRFPVQEHVPPDFVARLRVRRLGQRVDGQPGPLGQVQGVRDQPFLPFTLQRREAHLGNLRRDVADLLRLGLFRGAGRQGHGRGQNRRAHPTNSESTRLRLHCRLSSV